jgi:hypothetical protein
MSNGFIALAVVGSVAVLIISLIQRFNLEDTNFFLWLLATGVGLGIGSIGASLAFFVAATLPLGQGSSGIPLVDWLVWPAIMFILTAVGGAPGGLISGPLKKWAVGRGTLGSWVAVSIGNWALSFGVAGVSFLILLYPQYFNLHASRNIPVIIKGGMIGALIGLIQGTILGTRLAKLNRPEPSTNDSSSVLSEET